MNDDPYTEEYFLRGKQSGLSLYENYRWLPDLTIPMACAMARYVGIGCDDTVLDFGCARGYLVRALRDIGHIAWGYDISRWALDNADETIKDYLTSDLNTLNGYTWPPFDWVIAKDVLEHVFGVAHTINWIMSTALKGAFVVVPLATEGYGIEYVVPEYELDVTHIHRLTLNQWVGLFLRPGWRVEVSYRVEGIKDNYSQYHRGNGFILARRIR